MNRITRVALFACLVLAGAIAPVYGQAAGTNATIDDLAYSGSASVGLPEQDLHIWRSGSHEFTATVSAGSGFDGEVCLRAVREGDGAAGDLGCESASIGGNLTEQVAVAVDRWPENRTGTLQVRAHLTTSNASDPVDERSLPITALERDGDLDGDGLQNEREASLGTGLRTADTDGDGLPDGEEVETYGTSPTANDSDGDGLLDRAEIETHQTDPTTTDTDDDGLSDPRELDAGTNPNKADSDGDGVTDALELNTYDSNPTAPDTDGDGLDDGAEVEVHETNPSKPDTDDDGLNDALETNTYGTDPNVADSDGDGLEDGVEVAEYQTDPAVADTDGDGLDDGREVTQHGTNPTNPDTDGDGLEDGPEVNRYETDPTTADSDGDGRGDAIEESGSGPTGLAALGVVGVLAALVVGYGVVRYRSDGRLPLPRWRSSEPADDEAASEAASEAGDAVVDAEAVASDVPPEFLPNEEQVLGLLDDHGGRMRQTALVEETGWSKSKVSRVLAEMEEDGQIVKVDVGKGNVVTRPEDLPEGARPPFEA